MAGVAPTILLEPNLVEVGLWLWGRRRRFTVAGVSMEPLLSEGEVVLVDTQAYREAAPVPGDVVLALHPLRQDFPIIKQVTDVLGDGSCLLLGINTAHSTDSRMFGAVPGHKIKGKVTCLFSRPKGAIANHNITQ